MDVPRNVLPHWDDIQLMMATKPLMENQRVGTELVIGSEAKKPLTLKIPLFVSDMSFGALSEEAKIALATGANLAGTGIYSGEGGIFMLPEEQAANKRYFYEYTSAGFGYKKPLLNKKVQAFHFKGGQGAKTGTSGHLPGNKNQGKISQVRGIPEAQPAVSLPTFKELSSASDFKRFADRVREITGGIPIDFVKALALGADGIALSNSAMQAIGCVGARMCNTNNCRAGIATQKPDLRQKLNIKTAST